MMNAVILASKMAGGNAGNNSARLFRTQTRYHCHGRLSVFKQMARNSTVCARTGGSCLSFDNNTNICSMKGLFSSTSTTMIDVRRKLSSMMLEIERSDTVLPNKEQLTNNNGIGIEKVQEIPNATYDQSIRKPFPSLVIGSERTIQPQGSFAEAQAQFLDPDYDMVETIRDGLLKTDMGIVAHYYMDVELQGVLQALKYSHPEMKNRIGIADSLKMGDIALDMCRDHGVTNVICLGVDFMSESVQAILGKNGFDHIPVYRATANHIGCSLAESAETDTYRAWLHKESAQAVEEGYVPLHVIYINTSLETKAVSSSIVPTITCTSSNVVQTMLQAASEIPNLRILYGPDTYMGENLNRFLQVITEANDWSDSKIKKDLHPAHTNSSLKKLSKNLVVFPQGNCVVHHMFGNQVVDTVKEQYFDKADTYVTAHLEVPGEMFDIAMEKSLSDGGVVGSTSDILNFITRKVQEATDEQSKNNEERRLRFILGTEAGMVTSIVKNVQDILDETSSLSSSTSKRRKVEAEIIFPVSAEAVLSTEDSGSNDISNLNGETNSDLPIVPGVAGGEGCSTAGGCATCPFMKMNDLDAVQDIINLVDDVRAGDESNNRSELRLAERLPPTRLRGKSIDGVDATELGTEAILYMRKFMQSKAMPDELVQKVTEFSPK